MKQINEVTRMQQLAGLNEVKVSNPNKIKADIINQENEYIEIELKDLQLDFSISGNNDYAHITFDDGEDEELKEELLNYLDKKGLTNSIRVIHSDEYENTDIEIPLKYIDYSKNI